MRTRTRLMLMILALVAATGPASAAGRWWGGGGLGLAFGGDVDWVSVEPILGYSINERLAVGTRLIFRYRSDDRFAESIDATDYGAALFSRYMLGGGFFAQGEYEYLDYEYPIGGGDTDREGYDSVLAGGGYAQPLGKNASFFVVGLYNLSYDDDERSPYDDPWVFRAGVGFHF